MTRLVRPAPAHLAEYEDALRRGWSPDNVSPAVTAREHLAAIADDPAGFLAASEDLVGGAPIGRPDGTAVPRLPGFRRWIWDGGFCGSVNFRWQKGTAELPPHVLGHIGYAVVPWRRREG